MQLYFIALLPTQVIQDEVTAYKEEAKTKFGSGHALKSPPHITLIPPFRTDRTDFSVLREFAVNQSPFDVQLDGFDRFDRRVIFVHVVTDQPLAICQKRLALFCSDRLSISIETRPFHPHMTVAFKDLNRSVFPDAWAYFSTQSYHRTFSAAALTLLRHTGQRWEIAKEFAFNA